MLFLHGYLSDKNAFALNAPAFMREFKLYSLDLKGFGEDKDMPYPYSLNDYIGQVKDFVKANGLVRPSVIAHSFGGRIAIKLAATEKDFFDKIVLVGSAGIKPKDTPKKFIKRSVYRLLKKAINKEKLARFFSSDYNSLSPVMKESFIKIINEHLDGYLNDITSPTLVVFGEKDKETPPYMAKRLYHGIAGARLIIIKNAGHFCFLDAPNKFNGEVKEFLLE